MKSVAHCPVIWIGEDLDFLEDCEKNESKPKPLISYEEAKPRRTSTRSKSLGDQIEKAE
jgi:hypothetical protein